MTLLNDTIKSESPKSENSQLNNINNKGKEEKEAEEMPLYAYYAKKRLKEFIGKEDGEYKDQLVMWC